jgi:hypothetical protein
LDRPVTKISVLAAGLDGLVDRVLDDGPVDDRQHLLWNRLGRGKETGAQACHREHGFLQFHGRSLPKGKAAIMAERLQ